MASALAVSDRLPGIASVPPARIRSGEPARPRGVAIWSMPSRIVVVPVRVLEPVSRSQPPSTARLSRRVPPPTVSRSVPANTELPVSVSVESREVELLPIVAAPGPLRMPTSDWSYPARSSVAGALAPTVTVAPVARPLFRPRRAVPSLTKKVPNVPPPANTTVPIRMLTVAPVGATTGPSTTSVPLPVVANAPPLVGLPSTVTVPPASRPVPLPSY